MKIKRKYLVAVALLAVLAVVFGLAGTVAPASESVAPKQSSSDSVTHFMYPSTFDSGWVDITDKAGQYFTLKHDLNTTEVVVDITGKQSLDPMGGAFAWNKTYGGADNDVARSVVQTSDGGYAMAGFTASYATVNRDAWLVKTDSNGNMEWNKTHGGADYDWGWSVVQTTDGGHAMAGYSESYGAGSRDSWLVKVNVEMDLEHQRNLGTETGLAWTGLTNYTIILYRGETDPYWNYVRVRMWLIKEPTWQYGDLDMDGDVDPADFYIFSQHYGKTFSALGLGGIIAIACIETYRKRKQPE